MNYNSKQHLTLGQRPLNLLYFTKEIVLKHANIRVMYMTNYSICSPDFKNPVYVFKTKLRSVFYGFFYFLSVLSVVI